MPSFGYNSYIGFARESTHGTYVAATNFLRILNESVKPAYGRVKKYP